MKYYDTTTHTETTIESEVTIPSDDPRVAKFFEPLAPGEKVMFGDDGLPYFYTDNFLRPKVIDGKVVEGITTEEMRSIRLSRLEAIFNEKTTGLKKLAIDKPYMTNPETINNQYRVYEEMYKNALKGYYDDATNQAIIQANEVAKQALAPITLLLNSVRSVIEAAIMVDDPRSDAMLDAAAGVSLNKEDLTPRNINHIKEVFGL